MDIKILEAFLAKKNQPKFRLDQIKKAIYRDGISSFLDITNVSKDLRKLLSKEIKILSFSAENILVSKDQHSIKALLKLNDGNLIETVLISPKPDIWSACISSQVGCPLGCGFCATGLGGFRRNLSSEEISDQVLFWRQYLKKNNIQGSFGNIVYMGMGEPFLNFKNVSKSLKDLTDPDLFAFGSRSISVSTAGIPEGIEKLSEEFPQINLAISLHFATDEKRSKFMPINRKYGLEKLRESLDNYFGKTKRKVFVEYLLLSGVNDSRKDAESLIRYLKLIGHLQLLHVNLIRYNTTSDALKSSDKATASKFKEYLLRSGIGVTIRKSLGEDIQGACGQLAGVKKATS